MNTYKVTAVRFEYGEETEIGTICIGANNSDEALREASKRPGFAKAYGFYCNRTNEQDQNT